MTPRPFYEAHDALAALRGVAAPVEGVQPGRRSLLLLCHQAMALCDAYGLDTSFSPTPLAAVEDPDIAPILRDRQWWIARATGHDAHLALRIHAMKDGRVLGVVHQDDEGHRTVGQEVVLCRLTWDGVLGRWMPADPGDARSALDILVLGILEHLGLRRTARG